MIACIYFTREGESIALEISKHFGDVKLFSEENYKDNIRHIFEKYDRIIFICAVGIAVRVTAPFIKNKWVDPAVIVIDDFKRYVISLLSGHYGGANEFCNEIASFLNAQAIITTASDSRGFKSLDIAAKENNFEIEDPQSIKKITSLMLEKKEITVFSDIGHIDLDYPYISDNGEGFIYITYKEKLDFKKPFCILRPKVLNVGIGCRRGISKEKVERAVKSVFDTNNLSLKSIRAIATIDIKSDEGGILEFAEERKLPVKFFSKEDIVKVQEKFMKSEFVRQNIGVFSVAEPCAYLLSPEIIVKKTAVDGVTVSVSKEVYDG